MRDIKFRFWRDKKMQGILELEQGGILDMAWEWDNVDQFTGLLDRSGKEIYESDICEWKERSTHALGLDWINKIEIKWLDSAFVEDNNARLTQEDADDCEIIGNLYETPELLELK